MDEIWKPIKNWEYYEVSNLGRVRRIPGYCKRGETLVKVHGGFLKGKDNGKGYLRVWLQKDGVKKRFYIHRLVAATFIPNPQNKPCVNHIDNTPSNHRVDNLEWCTHKENMDWSFSQGRSGMTSEKISKIYESQRRFFKPVIGTEISTGKKLYFVNLNKVKESGFEPSCVSNCCKGKRKDHKGFTWEYAERKE